MSEAHERLSEIKVVSEFSGESAVRCLTCGWPKGFSKHFVLVGYRILCNFKAKVQLKLLVNGPVKI